MNLVPGIVIIQQFKWRQFIFKNCDLFCILLCIISGMITFYILHGHHYLGFGRSKSQHSMLIIGSMQRISRQHTFHIRVFFSVIYSLTRMFSDPSPLLTDEIILARSKGFNLQTMIHSHLMQKLCSALGPLEKNWFVD